MTEQKEPKASSEKQQQLNSMEYAVWLYVSLKSNEST